MPIIQWTDALSVKVREFDDQHKTLCGLVNDLHDAMSAGRGRDVLGKTLMELVEYTNTHFAAEEAMMTKYAFPHYARHKQEHSLLTSKVLQFQADFMQGKVAMTIEVMQFLKDWLTNHIQKTDRQYCAFFAEKGLG